jgi:zinc/manganese transport system substrate-binding protein
VTTHGRIRIGTITVATLTTATLLLAGCSSTSSKGTSTTGAGSTTSAAAPVSVVASSNVWGDITKQIGGDHVNVTSILSDPNADPHQY